MGRFNKSTTAKAHDKKFNFLLELPEPVLFQIVAFVAPRTQRAGVICHTLVPLCKATRKALLDESLSKDLWELVLAEDYDISTFGNLIQKTRRSKRLRRSAVDQVRDAHRLIRDNTELAYYHLWELGYGKGNAQSHLTKSKFCSILDEFGPHLRVNTPVSSGGTFLVEVCRARNTSQAMILQCIAELVERRGALVNVQSRESESSFLTPLCVAAARGLFNVVSYLLQHGANRSVQSCGRFRLHSNPKRSIKCNGTAFDFAVTMKREEKKEGAATRELVALTECITLLSAK